MKRESVKNTYKVRNPADEVRIGHPTKKGWQFGKRVSPPDQ